VLSCFLFWRPSVCPRLSAAAEASICQARSSRDSITIGEALGVRLGPARRRSGILIVKVIAAPPRDLPISLAGVPGSKPSLSLLILRDDLLHWLLAGCSAAPLLCLALVCSYFSSLGPSVRPRRRVAASLLRFCLFGLFTLQAGGLVWISADKACQFLDEIPDFDLNVTANAAKATWNSGVLFKI
jgi:hypothetical protein